MGQEPAGLFRDELISGYVGRFILQNGRDLYGHLFPLVYFDKYGDYPPVLPMYFSGLGTYFFGFTAFAIRFPVALIGSLVVFPLFALTKYLFKNTAIALLAAGIIAVLPWHIVLSRATAEGVITLTLFVSALYFFIRGVYEEKAKFLVSGILLFLLTYFFYPSYRITMPLLLLPMPVIFYHVQKRIRLILIAAIVVAFGLTFGISSTQWGQGRYKQTSIFTNYQTSAVKPRLDLFIQEEGQNNIFQARAFHNKIIGYTREITYQYINYFSTRFLFVKGGLPARYVVPDVGLLYISFAPLLLAGLFFLFKIKDKKVLWLLLVLFLIGPLPAPITTDDVPNIHRSLLLVIPFTMLIAYGAYALFVALPKKIRFVYMVIFCLCIMGEFVYFSHQYMSHMDAYQSVNHSDTNTEFIQTIITLAPHYQNIIMPVHDAMPLYYLYYSHNFSASLAGTLKPLLRMDSVGKVQFVDNQCVTKDIKKSDVHGPLLVVTTNNSCVVPSFFKEVTSFTRHDGTSSFVIYSAK